jgi:hypothetical protein
MDLESAAEREMTVHGHACYIAGPQLRRAGTANVRLERDVVRKVSGELQTLAKNHHAAARDLQHDDFIPETISRGDAQGIEVVLGDLNFSCEAIVGHAWFIVQSGLSARIYRDHWLEARFQPG